MDGEQTSATTAFRADAHTYRYSGGTILQQRDDSQRLLLALTVYADKGHDSSPSEICAWPSRDGGRRWVAAERRLLQENIGDNNVLNPTFLRLGDDDVLLFFDVGNGRKDAGVWMRRSDDNAVSFGPPQRLPYRHYGGLNPDQALLLSGGRILVPCFRSPDELQNEHAYCFYSDDGGETWAESDEFTVPIPADRPPIRRGKVYGGHPVTSVASEPSVAELADGSLLMLVRTYAGHLYASRSKDGGATWCAPYSSGIPAPGARPTLTRVPSTGDLLLVYNAGEPEEIHGPTPRNRMASLISRDQGVTWSSYRLIDGGPGFNGKMTNSTVAFVGDDALVGYSKVDLADVPPGGSSNHYSWVQRRLPLEWLYNGDDEVVFGG